MKKLILFLFIIWSSALLAEDYITIDGRFDDWDDVKTAYEDELGDGSSGGVDFQKIKITDDDKFVYFYFEVTNEISLQNAEDISLLVDLDNNPETGKSYNDIGADLIWNFQQKNGQLRLDGKKNIMHYDIELFPAPTITSDRFEVAISKNASVDGKKLFDNDEISFVVKDMFDKAPDETSVKYKFANFKREFAEIKFKKPVYSDLRFVCYNILFDSPFKDGSDSAFKRIFEAADGDVYVLQEMYDHSAEQVQELIDKISTKKYYVDKLERDLIIISKYEIIDKFQLDGTGAFFIDTPDDLAPEMLIVNAHLKCCDYDYVRLKQTNQLMNYFDLLKKGRQIRENTPVIIAGDMNFVGNGEQLDMLLNGNRKGKPDWDSSPFEELYAPVPNMPIKMTWYDLDNKYAPGRLDYVIYSDSQLKVANSFVLLTKFMNDSDLKELKLNRDDSMRSSDHLPVIVDFIIR